ncbi:Anaerobic sulfite reductase subunit A [Phycisphaerae bacterium RAS1]|nr:Anaerobic sulfite reductase subunit A [Phycisphaerae bacterium RAS1]
MVGSIHPEGCEADGPAADDEPELHGLITREALLERIDGLTATHKLIGPVQRSEPQCNPPRRFFYEPVTRASELALDFDYCVYGPKSVLLPPRETLLRYDTRHRRFEAVAAAPAESTALVGVHPCDVHAIATLDRVFEQDHPDEHYLSRRERLFVVGIDCPRPCAAGAFCADLHTNTASAGFDVMLYPFEVPAGVSPAHAGGAGVSPAHAGGAGVSPAHAGGAGVSPAHAGGAGVSPAHEFGVVFGTQSGRNWLSEAVRRVSPGDRQRFRTYLQAKAAAFPRRLTAPRERIPAILRASYDSPVWEANALRCYSCSSCNLVCPTCYCFDIQDELDLPPESGCRTRAWDSCMLRDFALVAGGHNFRSKQAARLRHRILRKGAWIEQRSGRSGCVGCARCERACTAHIGISDIINQLSEEHPGAKA